MTTKNQCRQKVGVRLGLRLTAAGAILALPLWAPAVLAQSAFQSFWGPFSPRPSASIERPVDASRAPAPRKVDTPPTSTVLVLGDSMADWLAYGLEDALSDTPEIGVIRKHRTASGLIRYDARNDSLDWAQAAKEAIAADKPSFIVMMVGLNDRQAIRERPQPARAAAPGTPATAPGKTAPSAQPQAAERSAQQAPEPESAEQNTTDPSSIMAPEPQRRAGANVYEFRSEPWAEAYGKRIDDTIAVLKSRNVPVFWVGLPSIRGPKSTGEMIYLNEMFRTHAEKAGINYIDVWDGFVDEGGRFALQGPDFEGQIRRLRASDGVHFTKSGARKLAHFVEREIRRVSVRGPVPVALPASEPVPAPQQSKTAAAPAVRPGGAVERPLSGPVMPLTVSAAPGEDLLGSGPNAAGAVAHVTATRVLVKGEPVAAPAGRGDDFSWPRRSIAAFGADPVVAATTLPIPVMRPPPAATTVPVPNAEASAVAAATAKRAAPRPQRAAAPAAPAASQTSSFFRFFR